MGFLNYTGLLQFWSKLKGILDSKITGDGVSNIKILTQEEYDALTTAEKNNGTVYITDDGIEAITDEEIDALFQNEEAQT